MAFDSEQRVARHILDGIELGRASAEDSFALLEDADPTFVYLLFAWLRARYAGHSAMDGVYGRIVAICTSYPATTRMLKKGEADPLVQWFEESYEYRELDAESFIRVVVEKLES